MKKIVVLICVVMASVSVEAQTITMKPLTQLTYCVGESGMVMYHSSGTFDSSNVFVVQLSSPGSSFSGWSIIGRATADSGTIIATFSDTGSYRLRVASTNPGAFSNDNGANIYVAGPPVPTLVAIEPWEVGTQYPSPVSIEASKYGNQFVGVQDDTIHIFDQNDDSAVRHQWTFDQDAKISSSTLGNPTVIWASGGTKTGGVRTWNSEGCTDTASVSLFIESCNPVIPKDAHIVTGTEGGDYADVWIKAGGAYNGDAAVAFIESGGEFSVPDNGGNAELAEVYVKRGASLIVGTNAIVDVGVLDTGASLSCNSSSGCNFLHCNSLQFDYSLVQPSIVENPPPSNVTIFQSGDHLFANGEGLPIEIRISNLLGEEVLSQRGTGVEDVDLSTLPVGVYFAVIEAGNDREVKRIAVVH